MSQSPMLVPGRETGAILNQRGTRPCCHEPRCPSAAARDRLAAIAITTHPEQGWSLLCNGVIAFDDGGEITPLEKAAALCTRSRADRRR
jgi:hypothetical protein